MKLSLQNSFFRTVSKHASGIRYINVELPVYYRSKTGRIKSEFKNEACALNCDVDLDLNGPAILASAVFGYNGEKLLFNY